MITQAAATWSFDADGTETELVALDGWLVEPPKATASQRMFEARGVLAADAYFRPLGGATARISLGVEVEHADREAMQARHLTLGEGPAPVTVAGVLRLTFADGSMWEFDPAVCEGVTPGIPFYGAPATWEQWSFIVAPIPTFTAAP